MGSRTTALGIYCQLLWRDEDGKARQAERRALEEKVTIRAAGGLLWRRTERGYELAVIHRRRHDDWTLPKGKLEKDETWEAAALREVREETGFEARPIRFAGTLSYTTPGGPKLVYFWHMLAQDKVAEPETSEVEELVWLSREAALQRLQYPQERALLEAWPSPDMEHEGASHAHSRRWRSSLRRSFRSTAEQRLDASLMTFSAELEGLLAVNRGKPEFQQVWGRCARELLREARRALNEGDRDSAWRCFKAARRLSFHGLTNERLEGEAMAILREANTPIKGVSAWRRDAINDLLKADGKGRPGAGLKPHSVEQAARLLDESHDNIYWRLMIVARRLRALSIICVLLLVPWLVVAPTVDFGLAEKNGARNADIAQTTPRLFWLLVMLAGLFGALLSGFVRTMEKDERLLRIPSEVARSADTYARLALACLSAVILILFLSIGFFSVAGNLSLETALVLAFVAGFSERLLMRPIQALLQPEASDERKKSTMV